MTTHRITNASDVRTGNALPANRTLLGVPLSNVVTESIVPAVADADAFLVAATSTEIPDVAETVSYTYPAANVSPTDAALRTGILDVPRNVVAVVTHGSSVVAMTITIRGTDKYGVAMRETLAIAATGTSQTATGAKAFKTITQIDLAAAADASANTVNIGTGIKLGLSYRPKVGGFIRGILNENTADAGTYVAPERTASTGTSVDVRGTYAYAGTANGTNIFTVAYIAANGPSDADAFGIAQYNG